MADTTTVDQGSTLAEVLVAMLLLVLLAASSSTLAVSAAAGIARARLESVALFAAQSRIEQLRALAWGFGSAHDPIAGADATTRLDDRDPAAGGPGVADSPATALDADTPGFVDYLDVRGHWVGSGPTPPTAARFVRRWSVRRVTVLPDVLVLQVRVFDRRRRVADIRLATMKAKVAG